MPTATVSARLRGPGRPVATRLAVEIDRPGQPSQRLPVHGPVPATPLIGDTPFTVRFEVPRSWASGRFGYRLVAEDAPPTTVPTPAAAPPRRPAPPRAAGRRAERRRGRGVTWLCALLLACGFLMTADGVLTIVWQDPVTAAYAAHQQSILRNQLKAEQREFVATRAVYPPPPAPPAHHGTPTDRAQLAFDARLLRKSVGAGDALGTIAIPKIGVRFTLVEGTSDAQLRRGPAHYDGTALPGESGTVAIAGHRTTYLAPFRHLDGLHRGDEISIEMPYGRFVYSVVQQGIVDPSSTAVLHQAWGAQWLVLTSCHPVRSAADRIVVVAKLRSEHQL